MEQPGPNCNKSYSEIGKPKTTCNNPEVTPKEWNKATSFVGGKRHW